MGAQEAVAIKLSRSCHQSWGSRNRDAALSWHHWAQCLPLRHNEYKHWNTAYGSLAAIWPWWAAPMTCFNNNNENNNNSNSNNNNNNDNDNNDSNNDKLQNKNNGHHQMRIHHRSRLCGPLEVWQVLVPCRIGILSWKEPQKYTLPDQLMSSTYKSLLLPECLSGAPYGLWNGSMWTSSSLLEKSLENIWPVCYYYTMWKYQRQCQAKALPWFFINHDWSWQKCMQVGSCVATTPVAAHHLQGLWDVLLSLYYCITHTYKIHINIIHNNY